MQKILIIQTAFLGDVVLATPLIENLKNQFPQSEISFLVRKGNESLLRNHPKIHQLFTFDKRRKWSEIWRLTSAFRKEKFDLVINLQRFASSGLIAVLSGGKEIRGFKENPFSFAYHLKKKHLIQKGTHEVDRNLSLIPEVFAPVRHPKLYPSDSDFEFISNYQSETYFCLAPSSVWFTKAAPVSVWVKLCKELSKKGRVYLLGGPNDATLANEIIAHSGVESLENLCGKLSLLQSAALMSRAKRNFVNDSGPLHLASSMNAAVTAFFCSTIPEFGFGPLSDDSKIIQVENLDCRPCGLHGHQSCPKVHFRCGEELGKTDGFFK